MTVKEKEIALDKTTAKVEAGKTVTLQATTSPDNEPVIWKTSSSDIATVTAGEVEGVKAGTVTITAALSNKPNVSADCTVTVIAPSITVTPATATVGVNKTVTLTATTTPAGKAVKWTSSNASIATVAASGDVTGVVTGKASGDVTIRAVLSDDATVSADCKVTVTPASPKTVVVSPTAVSVDLGRTRALTAKPTPASEDVVWTTSNAAIASVDQKGVVTGVGLGNAIVRAVLSSDKTISGSCAVTVMPVGPSVTLSLASKDATVQVGRTVTVKATVSPDTTPVYWLSTNIDIATVTQTGMVTGVKAGRTKIWATTGALSADCTVTVTAAPSPVDPSDPAELSGIDPISSDQITGGNGGSTVGIRLTFPAGRPFEDTIFFWMRLLKLRTADASAFAAAEGDTYGPYEGQVDANGVLRINVNALKPAPGALSAKAPTVVEAGDYDIFCQAKTASATTPNFSRARQVPTTVQLAATSATDSGNGGSGSGGGCEAAGLGGAALLAVAAFALKGSLKRRS